MPVIPRTLLIFCYFDIESGESDESQCIATGTADLGSGRIPDETTAVRTDSAEVEKELPTPYQASRDGYRMTGS